MPVYLNPMSSMKYNNIFIGLWLFLFGSILLWPKKKPMILVLKRLLWLNLIAPASKVFLKFKPFLRLTILWFKKIKVDYTFESIPVLSTFVPNKATPSNCTPRKFFLSQLIRDGGNWKSVLSSIQSFDHGTLDRMQSIGLEFLYNKVGAIDQTLLNSDQKRTSLNLLHQYKQNNMRVDSDLRFDRQGHNFFGLYDLDWTKISSFRSNVIDPTQNLNYLSIRSRWQVYDGLFNKVNFSTHITTDSFDSTEHIVKINTQIRIPFFNQYLELIPHLELINTDFIEVITMRKHWVSKRNGPIGASVFECWKKLKLLLGAKDLPFWRYRRRQSDIFCISKSRNFLQVRQWKMGSLRQLPRQL